MEGSRLGTSGPVESEAGEGRRRPRRGRGTTLTRESNVGRRLRHHVESGEAGEGLGRASKGSYNGHRHPCISDGVNGHQRGHADINTRNNPRTPESAKPPRKVATPLKMKAGHWRLGETAHLPEVSLFERFLSRARGVRPNRSTRTRRGLARRGGPTYSVIESFRDFWGCPIADLHYRRR